MKNLVSASALILASTLLLTACGGADSRPEITAGSMEELYEAAKAEGQITVYGPTENLYEAVYEDFKKEYPGIQIVTSDIFGQELDSRLEGETIAGGFEGDLLHIGVSDMERYRDYGYLESFAPMEAEGLPEAFLEENHLWSVPSQHLYGSAFNTKKTDKDSLPSTWDEWRDYSPLTQISTSNPKQSGVLPQGLSAASDAGLIDEGWIKDFFTDKSGPKVFPSVANALQTAVTGETAVSFIAGYGSYMRQVAQGAPLEFLVMDDGAFFSDVAYGVLDESPHPHAARLLVSWMFSDAGQASIAKNIYEFGTMPDAQLPEGGEQFESVPRIDYPGAEKYRSMLDLLNNKN